MLHQRIILMTVLLCLSYPCLATQHLNNLPSGVWHGAGTQDNGSHWRIRINIQTDFIVIDYPSLLCGGVLKPQNKNVFKEKLIYGKKRCIDQGIVVLNTIDGNKLNYYWFGKNGKLQATGVLTKEK